jgi:hypothetical protein
MSLEQFTDSHESSTDAEKFNARGDLVAKCPECGKTRPVPSAVRDSGADFWIGDCSACGGEIRWGDAAGGFDDDRPAADDDAGQAGLGGGAAREDYADATDRVADREPSRDNETDRLQESLSMAGQTQARLGGDD